ncbi:threonine-phosphate decarboxylase CobD [Bacillus solimangrovi]|uniref:threonine-phosphate decarboxylase n=1 Tax=Bacillus solimangrovi TaxID=1305675 RepID=A0A1E5LHH0_9BACI|nr:threonine-phosphate decarboxylase CobD [Bacillus solimangrovi]OEH93518.1 threonine-phosphate decarboxylase [Bacillus solimangrovi]
MNSSLPKHGANIIGLYEALGQPLHPNPIDFSVNTNPYGMPASIEKSIKDGAKLIGQYPEMESYTLRERIAYKEGLHSKQVLVGNGAAECIFLLARFFMKKTVGIIEPTFTEYALASTANQSPIKRFILNNNWQLEVDKLDNFIEGVDVLYCCHPNNPTGVAYGNETIEDLAERCNRASTTLIIDEAFYDFSVEEVSATKLLTTYPNVIIVRSFTKMYHIPGIRLGYVLARPAIIEALFRYQPPWSVNTLAQEIGLQCVADSFFEEETKHKIANERARVFMELEKLGMDYSNSAVNFYLLIGKTKAEIDHLIIYLLQNGIVPRHTYHFPGIEGIAIRLAIKDRHENDQLLHVLQRWRADC